MHASSADPAANDRDGAAEQLAQRVPLVHFPARLPMQATRALGPGWADAWDELTSNSVRGVPAASDSFSQLRAQHVFTYAGPCCYSGGPVPVGNAVLYLYPHVETARKGEVSPFDSGALEDPARLQPWATRTLAERWNFLRLHTSELGDWRTRFQSWLLGCYEDPWRYLESTPEPWNAGLPDRMDPPDLLTHNGPAGRLIHGDSCGDRRAWTWEVRFRERITWRHHLQLLHVGNAANERANDLADDIERETGVRPEVRSLPHDTLPDFYSLLERSGQILRECIAP